MDLSKGHDALHGLLDLSAAFDSVDHDVLLKRLEVSFGVCGTHLKWMKSNVVCRTQTVIVNRSKSSMVKFSCGIPQRICVNTFIIRPVHQRHQRHHTASWYVASMLCRRYAGLFLLQA